MTVSETRELDEGKKEPKMTKKKSIAIKVKGVKLSKVFRKSGSSKKKLAESLVMRMLVKTGFTAEKWPRYTTKIIYCINKHIELFLF